jgi:putative FmdB family regulatory protein
MPTYDYHCLKCDNIQEELHPMNENVTIKCTKCGSDCKKLISGTSFTIKGESWSNGPRMKKQMADKNEKMKNKMSERTDGVRNIGELKRHG